MGKKKKDLHMYVPDIMHMMLFFPGLREIIRTNGGRNQCGCCVAKLANTSPPPLNDLNERLSIESGRIEQIK